MLVTMGAVVRAGGIPAAIGGAGVRVCPVEESIGRALVVDDEEGAGVSRTQRGVVSTGASEEETADLLILQ